MDITPIAHVRSDFGSKFGIPRQSGIVPELVSYVVFEEGFRSPEALRGLEGFDYIWLIWEFSANRREGWSPTVRPPRLGGNVRQGVFATRSPYRPNPLGLSSVKLDAILDTPEGPVLRILGADLMDGTPVYDIKPYVGTDVHEGARFGFGLRRLGARPGGGYPAGAGSRGYRRLRGRRSQGCSSRTPVRLTSTTRRACTAWTLPAATSASP